MTSVSEHRSEHKAKAAAEHTADIHTTACKLADPPQAYRGDAAPGRSGRGREGPLQGGKLTARERIYALLDEGSFVELDALARRRSTNFGLGESACSATAYTGYDTTNGCDVCIVSDATVFGGSLGEVYCERSSSSKTSRLDQPTADRQSRPAEDP